MANVTLKDENGVPQTYNGVNTVMLNSVGGGTAMFTESTGDVAWGDITGDIANQTDLTTALGGKQATLVSGTNIKTINNNSLLGSGNIDIQSGTWGNINGTLSNQTDLYSYISRDRQRIDYIKEMLKGNVYDDYTLSGASQNVSVPSGAFSNAAQGVIGGMIGKFNQLVNITGGTKTSNGVTTTIDNDGVMTFSGVATTDYFQICDAISTINGHKYYIAKVVIANPNNLQIMVGCFDNNVNIAYATNEAIITNTSTILSGVGIQNISSGDDLTGVKIKFIICDLTAMQEDTTLTTVALFKAKYPLPYYPYSTGRLINGAVNKEVSNGFNLWDEEWEMGRININDGTLVADTTRYRSKNVINVLPNTQYYYKKSANSLVVCYYDNDNNYISYAFGNNSIQTTPSNCTKMRFYTDGTTYNHDICINVSDASLNGTYKPYRTPINYPVPSSIQALDGYGWGVSSTCYNYVDLVPTKYSNMKSVDLGTLNWQYTSGAQFFYVSLSDLKPTATNTMPNLLCNIYSPNLYGYVANINGIDMSIGMDSTNFTPPRLVIKNKSYTDANAFKTAMSGGGFILHYEATSGGSDYNALLWHKKVTRVKLKDFTWTYQGNYFRTNLSHSHNLSLPGGFNGLCNEYRTAWDGDKIIESANASYIIVYDSTYTDATAFKNHFTDDDYLYYEMPNEQVLDITSHYTEEDYNIINVEAGGTLTFHYTDLDNGYGCNIPSTTLLEIKHIEAI